MIWLLIVTIFTAGLYSGQAVSAIELHEHFASQSDCEATAQQIRKSYNGGGSVEWACVSAKPTNI